MEQISYIFYATVAMALFLLGYWLLMRREVRHQMVRFYLLSTMVLSLLLPMVHLRVPGSFPQPIGTAPVRYQFIVFDQQLAATAAPKADAFDVTDPQISKEPESEKADSVSMTLLAIVGCVYWLGVAVMVLLFAVRFVRLQNKLSRLAFSDHDGYRLAIVEGDMPAFSFGRRIVIGRSDFTDDELNQLLGHELVHVRQHHTGDVLLCEVLKTVFWFNPFVWLYAIELKRVHEYQADRQMVSLPNGVGYLELLYHQLSGRKYSAIGNNFDYSLTPKRINMMKQTKKRFGSLSLLVALPVMALVLFANCKKPEAATYVVDKIVMLADDEESTPLTCSEFFNLENYEFTFHNDGTVDVACTVDSSVNFTGKYVLNQHDGMIIYDASGEQWMRMDCKADYSGQDSIELTYTDEDPVRGLETMANALAINVFPVRKVSQTITTRRSDGTEEKKSGEVLDTLYPCVSIVSDSYDYMVEHGWFRSNRLLGASVCEGSKITGLFVNDDNDTVFESTWKYPTGRLAEDAHLFYDTVTYLNPKRDLHLQVTMKKK